MLNEDLHVEAGLWLSPAWPAGKGEALSQRWGGSTGQRAELARQLCFSRQKMVRTKLIKHP